MRLEKRVGILSIPLLILLSAGGLGQDPTPKSLEITHGPYLQNPGPDAITVIWFTNKKCVSAVQFGEEDTLAQIVRTSRHGLIDAYTTSHRVCLKELKPGMHYQYRVISQEITQFKPYEVVFGETITSEVYEFQTLAADIAAFTFYVINDVHERSRDLANGLENLSWQDVGLVFLNGDIINHFEREDQIFDGFLDACVEHFAREIPFIWIRGNHETRGALARTLLNYVATPQGRFHYAFEHGPVRFIILDSGEDKPDTHQVYAGLVDFDRYRDRQADWLKKEIASPEFRQAAFRIVLFHIPPYGGNDWHGEQYIRETWGPLLNRAGIDILICAHLHRFRHIPPQEGKNSYPILIVGRDMAVKADVTQEGVKIELTSFAGKNLFSTEIR